MTGNKKILPKKAMESLSGNPKYEVMELILLEAEKKYNKKELDKVDEVLSDILNGNYNKIGPDESKYVEFIYNVSRKLSEPKDLAIYLSKIENKIDRKTQKDLANYLSKIEKGIDNAFYNPYKIIEGHLEKYKKTQKDIENPKIGIYLNNALEILEILKKSNNSEDPYEKIKKTPNLEETLEFLSNNLERISNSIKDVGKKKRVLNLYNKILALWGEFNVENSSSKKKNGHHS